MTTSREHLLLLEHGASPRGSTHGAENGVVTHFGHVEQLA
jgi:hypothetical protein